jgi:DNA-binding PadR family transcriptional regulator
MATEYILLGLLQKEPRHGYDLAREFAPGTTLGEVLHLEPGLLYANLKKLEHAGFIRSTLYMQESRPPRKVFELTDAGLDELCSWLSEPVSRTRDLRLEFLLKLHVAREFDPDLAARLIAQQHDLCVGFVESLKEQLAAEEDSFRQLVIEMRLAQNRALLDWLAKARQHVVAG